MAELALLTTAEMTQADRLTIEGGTPGIDLMEAAGAGVADCALEADGVVHVLCGPGNNGGDGFVAARLLTEEGREVRLFLLGERSALKGDAALAAARWQGPVEPLAPIAVEGADVIIDALFGAGLTRPLEGVAAETVAAVNASDAIVIAVDVPSGLDGSTGKALGPVVEADETVAFFRPKTGHLLFPGRALCGDLTVVDIGIPGEVLETIRPQTMLNDPDLWLEGFPVPNIEAHKYARGHAVIVSGDALHTGASRLAAYGALRIGAGLVTLAGSREALLIHAAHVSSIMLAEAEDAAGLSTVLSDARKNACLIGPAAGLGMETKAETLAVLASGCSAVLDADVFTSFANEPDALLSALHDACVLTPHEGEFERVFPGLLDTSASRLEAARAAAAAAQAGVVVLLKGPDTVIAAPDGRAAINVNAPPTLATAGSGDVLAGIIVGLLAQGMGPFEAACAATWVHGEAASRFGPGLISADLPDLVPEVLDGLLDPDEE